MRSVNVATGSAAAGYAFCGNGGRTTVLMTLSFSSIAREFACATIQVPVGPSTRLPSAWS